MALRSRSRQSRAASRGRRRVKECVCGALIKIRYAAARGGSSACADCVARCTTYDR